MIDTQGWYEAGDSKPAVDAAVLHNIDHGEHAYAATQWNSFVAHCVKRARKVFYNNDEIGRTNSSGKVFIPNLSAFLDNQISINDKDIPMDYTISDIMKFVSPPLRSGSFVTFDVAKFQAITGKLKIRIDGEARPAEFAEVIMLVDGQEMTFPTGKGGEFYFENVKPGSYRTLLKYVGKECIFDMIVPESSDMILDLKEVICESDT